MLGVLVGAAFAEREHGTEGLVGALATALREEASRAKSAADTPVSYLVVGTQRIIFRPSSSPSRLYGCPEVLPFFLTDRHKRGLRILLELKSGEFKGSLQPRGRSLLSSAYTTTTITC